MQSKDWLSAIEKGEVRGFSLYSDKEDAKNRWREAILAFTKEFGEDRDIRLFSVPGRTEVQGNHTDHQNGRVLAASIDRDIIAVAAKREDSMICIKSRGYPKDCVPLSQANHPEKCEKFTSSSLIAGTVRGFRNRGFSVGGFDAYTESRVLKGSGISSSAAYEVMVGNILNHLYNEGKITPDVLAKNARYAENVFFGKPCGLMDQMACAVGGFVYIDFEDPEEPKVESIAFDPQKEGYRLAIVNTGGNHADLNEDYASVPLEMKKVASYFGKPVLRGIEERDLLENLPILRKTCGDRALLRAFHFVKENERVKDTARKLKEGDFPGFLESVKASGRSSYMYLQNVYTVKNVEEQGLSLALLVAETFLEGKSGAYRVHGGGFAGTVQVFLREEDVEDFRILMDASFGEGATMILKVRPEGAVEIRA